MDKSFTVTLRVPPSLNNAYANKAPRLNPVSGKLVTGRRRTVKYETWKKNAILTIFAQVPAAQRVLGPIKVTLLLPSDTPGDIDNRIKAVLDALVDSHRISDDRNIGCIVVERVLFLEVGFAQVTVEQWAHRV